MSPEPDKVGQSYIERTLADSRTEAAYKVEICNVAGLIYKGVLGVQERLKRAGLEQSIGEIRSVGLLIDREGVIRRRSVIHPIVELRQVPARENTLLALCGERFEKEVKIIGLDRVLSLLGSGKEGYKNPKELSGRFLVGWGKSVGTYQLWDHCTLGPRGSLFLVNKEGTMKSTAGMICLGGLEGTLATVSGWETQLRQQIQGLVEKVGPFSEERRTFVQELRVGLDLAAGNL